MRRLSPRLRDVLRLSGVLHGVLRGILRLRGVLRGGGVLRSMLRGECCSLCYTFHFSPFSGCFSFLVCVRQV